MTFPNLTQQLNKFAYIVLIRHASTDEIVDEDVERMERKYKRKHLVPCKICGNPECDGSCMTTVIY